MGLQMVVLAFNKVWILAALKRYMKQIMTISMSILFLSTQPPGEAIIINLGVYFHLNVPSMCI